MNIGETNSKNYNINKYYINDTIQFNCIGINGNILLDNIGIKFSTLGNKIFGYDNIYDIEDDKKLDDLDKINAEGNNLLCILLDTIMNNARASHSMCGVNNNALVVGGMNTNDEYYVYDTTEIFNGNTWTNSVNTNSVRFMHSMCGVSNNALIAGGTDDSYIYIGNTEIFNGNTWTININMNNDRYLYSMCGISNNALASGGTINQNNGYMGITDSTEIFNGNVWTNSANMNTEINAHSICGISNNALVSGGIINGDHRINATEIFNGNIWTNSANMNIIKSHHSMCGISNNALVAGGMNNIGQKYAYYNNTEIFNGNTWTNSTNMNINKYMHSMCGVSNNALITGGYNKNSDIINATEIISRNIREYKFTVTEESYSGLTLAGCNINRKFAGSVGISNNTLILGGQEQLDSTSSLSTFEKFDGSIWFVNTSNSNHNHSKFSMVGVSNNALALGGKNSYYAELYNGSYWTSKFTFINSQYINMHATTGTPLSNISTGGYNSVNNEIIDNSYIYNNYTLSTTISINQKRYAHSLSGNINNAIMCAGILESQFTFIEKFNGNIWKIGSNINIYREFATSTGISNSSLLCGGSLHIMNDKEKVYFDTTEYYNGDIWKNSYNVINNRGTHSASGTGSNNILLSEGNTNSSELVTTNNIIKIENKYKEGSVWISAANMNSYRSHFGGCGIVNNTLINGGYGPNSSVVYTSEIFSNNIWTNSVNSNINRRNHSMSGIVNSAISTCGCTIIKKSDTTINSTEIFNGTTWSNSININTAVESHNSCGTINSTLICGGEIDLNTRTNNTQTFNGTTWSKLSDLNNARSSHGLCGVINSTLAVGGENKYYSTFEIFNGNIWFVDELDNFCPSDYIDASGNVNNALIAGDFGHSSYKYNGNTFISSSDSIKESLNDTILAGTGNDALATNSNDNCQIYKTIYNIDNESDYFDYSNGKIENWKIGISMNNTRATHNSVGVANNTLVIAGGNSGTDIDYLYTDSTELFDGVTWFNTIQYISGKKRYVGACGVVNSTLIAGGEKGSPNYFDNTEFFNGSSWYSKNNMNNKRYGLTICGDTNNALAAGGSNSTGALDVVELFDGESWNNTTNMNNHRRVHSGCGVPTNALVAGGYNTSGCPFNNTELFNGITWSMGIGMNSIRHFHSMTGIPNNTLASNGWDGKIRSITSELFNGFIWINTADTNMPKSSHSLCGATNNSLCTGGGSSIYLDNTEIYRSTTDIDMYLPSTYKWSLTTELNGVRDDHSSVGITNNALTIGGYNNINILNTTEKFDGNTWTNSVNINNPRRYHCSCGVSNNALINGGINSTTGNFIDTVEIFNGTVWNNGIDMNTAKGHFGTCGVTNSVLAAGGIGTVYYNNAEMFNGITWYIINNMNISKGYHGLCGISNNALASGGKSDDTTYLKSTELFNGMVWANSIIMNIEKYYHSMCGITNNALVTGGKDSSGVYFNSTELFNGRTWSIDEDMIIKRFVHNNVGTSNNALSIGGINSTFLSSVEKYNSNTKLLKNNAWTIIADMNVNRSYFTGCGNINSTLVTGGSANFDSIWHNSTEIFSSNVWNMGTDMNNIKFNHATCGIVNSALAIAGCYKKYTETNTVEKFNGIIWNNVANTNVKRESLGCGHVNSALVSEGDAYEHLGTEIFDGNVWTMSSNMNEKRMNNSICGITNSALTVGGSGKSSQSGKYTRYVSTEIFNGTIWSINANTNNNLSGCGLVGNTNKALATDTHGNEIFNGTSWSIFDNLPNIRRWNHAATGDADNSIIAGGNNDCIKNAEMYTTIIPNEYIDIDEYENKYITFSNYNDDHTIVASWKNGPNMNSNRNAHNGCGNTNSSIMVGGRLDFSGYLKTTELFNGIMWINMIPLNIERRYHGVAGVSNNALAIAGFSYNYEDSINILTDSSELFNGLIWKNISNLNSVRADLSASGYANDALAIGGKTSINPVNLVERFNGTVWSTVINMNISRQFNSSCGNGINTILVTGGRKSDSLYLDSTETFNGLVWINNNNMNISRGFHSSCGVAGNALTCAGYSPDDPNTGNSTELFNGIVWYSTTNMQIDKSAPGKSGISNNALITGGSSSTEGINNITELFNNIGLYTNNKYTKQWVSMPSLIFNRTGHMSIGNKNNIVLFGGSRKNIFENTCQDSIEKFNSNIWQSPNKLMIHATMRGSSIGNENASILIGGIGNQGNSNNITNEEYNGYTFIDLEQNMNIADHKSIGKINNNITVGGRNIDTSENNVYVYIFGLNKKYYISNNIPSIYRYEFGMSGTPSNSIISCGRYDNRLLNQSEYFNGILWKSISSSNIQRCKVAMSGTYNNTIISGGTNCLDDKYTISNNYDLVELFDGNIWGAISNNLISNYSHTLNDNISAGGSLGLSHAEKLTDVYIPDPALLLSNNILEFNKL